ncbi:MAG: N-acetyltransferase [Pseudomonadota bacterium]
MVIHPTALISPEASIAKNVEIGPFCIVHDNVKIAEGCKIGSHCELGVKTSLGDGSPLIIGENAQIRSHSVFYESSQFGTGLVTGHRATVRELTKAGKNLQIGTQTDIQGTVEIGDYTRFHSNVFVGQHMIFGDFVWVFPHVVFTNDPHPPSNHLVGSSIRDFAAIGAKSTILPGLEIGKGALVAAASVVTRDVGEDRIALGHPAKDSGPTSSVMRSDAPAEKAYPWRRHFRRGYPENVVKKWLSG